MWEFFINFLTVVLGSGATIACFDWYAEHRRETRRRADDTEFLAVKLAIAFEGFTIECAEMISEDKLVDDTGGEAGTTMDRLPEAPQLPQSEAYKYFDKRLLDEIFQFPQDRLMAQRAALFWWNVVTDPEECRNAFRKNATRMGMKASQIAKQVRSKNKLPARALRFGQWDIDEFFRDETEAIHRSEEEEAANIKRRRNRSPAPMLDG